MSLKTVAEGISGLEGLYFFNDPAGSTVLTDSSNKLNHGIVGYGDTLEKPQLFRPAPRRVIAGEGAGGGAAAATYFVGGPINNLFRYDTSWSVVMGYAGVAPGFFSSSSTTSAWFDLGWDGDGAMWWDFYGANGYGMTGWRTFSQKFHAQHQNEHSGFRISAATYEAYGGLAGIKNYREGVEEPGLVTWNSESDTYTPALYSSAFTYDEDNSVVGATQAIAFYTGASYSASRLWGQQREGAIYMAAFYNRALTKEEVRRITNACYFTIEDRVALNGFHTGDAVVHVHDYNTQELLQSIPTDTDGYFAYHGLTNDEVLLTAMYNHETDSVYNVNPVTIGPLTPVVTKPKAVVTTTANVTATYTVI